MTTSQTYSYAKVLGWDELDLLASIAQRQQARPLPLAQMSIEVFDKESYDRIIDLVKELGPQHIYFTNQIIKADGNNRSRKPSLSGTDRQAQPNRAVC